MKKIISLTLAILMMLGCIAMFAACNKPEEESLSAAYDKALEAIGYNPDDYTEEFIVAISPDFAPMEFVDLAKSGDDKYVGFDVLLAKYLAKELNKKLVIKPMSFDAVQAAVQAVTDALGNTGRILVRESGTEPVIRVMVEAETEEICSKYVYQVVDVLKAKGHVVA